MAKPICIIRVGSEALIQPSGQKRPYYEFQQIFEERMPDYHVFCIPLCSDSTEYFTFEVFHEKDFTDIQYQELKELITKSINEIKPE